MGLILGLLLIFELLLVKIVTVDDTNENFRA